MEDKCVCCGDLIPEGRQTCWKCEQAILKVGKVLQNDKTLKERTRPTYEFLYW